MKKFRYVEVRQPIGTFYLTSVPASILVNVLDAKPRGDYPDAVQREQSKNRAKEIGQYCSDPDATFPTSIIVSINEHSSFRIDDEFIHFDESTIIGEVIDGQHRLAGLKLSENIESFDMPVAFMIDLEVFQKAYVFSIINSKQTRVSMSLIYDLFALSKNRSPYKTCHEITRALNKTYESPFFRRLKMLGKKEKDQELASISQGSFVKFLLSTITKNPDEDTRRIKRNEPLQSDDNLVFRQYFIEGRDDVILKILLNLFGGLSRSFHNEWNLPNEYILSKSIGYGAILRLLPELFHIGKEEGRLDEAFFEEKFSMIEKCFSDRGIKLTSEYYGSNDQGINKLYKEFSNVLKELPRNS